MVTCVFPRFRQFARCYSEFSLAALDLSCRLIGFYDFFGLKNKKTLELCYWNMGQVEGKKVALNHMIPNLVVPFDYIDLYLIYLIYLIYFCNWSICCLTWPLVDTSPSIRFVLCAVLWNWRRRHTFIHEGSSISKSMFYVLFYHSEVALNLLLYLCL